MLISSVGEMVNVQASFIPVTGLFGNWLLVVMVMAWGAMIEIMLMRVYECYRSHCTEAEYYASGLLSYLSSLDVTFMELFRFVTLLVVVV